MDSKINTKNTFLIIFLPAVLLFCNCSLPYEKTDQPHIYISSCEDMAKIGTAKSHPLYGIYTLLNDITLENWMPIGNEAAPFTGVFNGGEKTIHLKSFSDTAVSGQNYLGIFGCVKGGSVTEKAGIKNLTIISAVEVKGFSASALAAGLLTAHAERTLIENINITGKFTFESKKTILLGGIAGFINQSETIIRNSSSSLTMNIIPGSGSGLANYSYIGGIAGMFRNGAGIENCKNSGNVTADNTLNEINGQVFAGGIAGGGFYSMSSNYQGYIIDSSYTGNITGKANGEWTFTGGIAAVIAGSGTKIERCFVTGTVSVEGTASDYPYVGGIAGYNYFGALISQSYFNGTVIAAEAGDYTGGIAGYNSQTTAPNNARIEDCWSAGTVKGFNNAGGIVGQNQVNTYIRRCYSTAAIEATNSAGAVGGIAGLHQSAMTDAVTSCVALNVSIEAAAGDNLNRITANGSGIRSNNYALAVLIPATGGTYTERKGLVNADGEDIPSQYLSGGKPAQNFYIDVLNWDFNNVWILGADGYPKHRWNQQ